MPSSHIPFSHGFIETPVPGHIGVIYMIGTLQECREWQLRKGVRATTVIIPML